MAKPDSKGKFFNLIIQAIPLIVFISIWQIYVTIVPEKQFIFSSPVKIIQALWGLIISLDLFRHAFITIFETVIGFVLGTFSGSVLGLMLWYSPRVARLSRPYILAIGAIPIFALAPVMIAWFGIGIFSKIMMAALSTVVIAIVQAYQGASSVEEKYIHLMHVMRARRSQIFTKIVIPSALIWVTNSMKLNIGFALLGAFIGEFISSEKGLGYLIVKSAGLYDMATVFAGCITLAGIALLLNYGVERLECKLLSWRS